MPEKVKPPALRVDIYLRSVSIAVKTEAYEDRAVHARHGSRRKLADARHKTSFVDRSDLFQKNDRILLQTVAQGELDMGREPRLMNFACDRRRNDGGGILVARIVLHHENGADPALLASHDGT